MMKMGPEGKKRSDVNEEKKEEASSRGTARSTELGKYIWLIRGT